MKEKLARTLRRCTAAKTNATATKPQRSSAPRHTLCPWQELLDYREAEPLGGLLLRRPLTRVWCGGGIALSHQRAGSSSVSAGGTTHGR